MLLTKLMKKSNKYYISASTGMYFRAVLFVPSTESRVSVNGHSDLHETNLCNHMYTITSAFLKLNDNSVFKIGRKERKEKTKDGIILYN